MSARSTKELPGLIPLFLSVCVVTVGAYFVCNTAMTQILRVNTESKARLWSENIVRVAPAIEDVVLGRASLDLGTQATLRRHVPGSIHHYRIFDNSGRLRWDSRDYSPITKPLDVAEIDAEASSVLAENQNVFHLREFAQAEETVRLSVAMIPLDYRSRTIGVLEVAVDTSAQWAALSTILFQVLAQILGLVFVAFLLPGILYLRRSGQLEFLAGRLHRNEEYDELTGTLNRAAFSRVLERELGAASERGMSVAVHLIDLDRFQIVNDTRGHAVGDALLKMASDRLHKLFGIRERLARLGGDEFAICQPHFRNTDDAVDSLAKDVVRAMSKPFRIGDDEIQIGASLGHARSPADGKTASELFRAADIALSEAKAQGRGRSVAFDMAMEVERQARQDIEQRLRHALSTDGFELNFQPFYEISTGDLRGFEALLRLSDKEGMPISPDLFIPVAEDIGLIGEIGAWVLQESCRTASEWPEHLVVSVNLSPAQFNSHDMPELVRDTLKKTGMDARRLELEVTESLLIADTDKILKELRKLKKMGVSIALDDFGTGYSSLSYLWLFPFDKLKVDKTFMSDLAEVGSKSREILSTIVALGKVLDLKITAEGVETEVQAEVLRSLDCDLVQGFHYGRPMRLADVAATLLKSIEMTRPAARKQRA